MKDEAVTDALLRQFLLGQVDDEERQRIESLFITDSLIRERILVAEQDLIEEYLDDSLPTADRNWFLSQYADTPIQQRRLRIAKTITDWAGAEPRVTQPPVPVSIWTRLRSRFNLKPVIAIPIAVAAAVTIIFAIVWWNGRIERNRQHLALEQEIARLNGDSRELSSPSSPTLPPLSFRSAEPSEVIKRGSVQVLELRLLSLQRESYQSYRVVLHRVGDNTSFTIPNLDLEPGKIVAIKLPIQALPRGTYQIELSGVTADGSASAPEEYRFTVRE